MCLYELVILLVLERGIAYTELLTEVLREHIILTLVRLMCVILEESVHFQIFDVFFGDLVIHLKLL